ncbi:ATP-dependent DNA ligase [Limosilactobacillus reuteri]|uniref:ATP-dependent DNA ligase n=1 Tax=Limosilactobacillus reuteri TaxID=1598 RepID=UPI00214B332E|nr:ligase [Limosilactobacillus reuteri]MCR1878040.1 ligase [Limosilactobacillus reuteri]
MMETIINDLKVIIDEISAESSNNNKITILKKNADNEEFKKLLKFVYDDFIRTGLSVKTLNETPRSSVVATDYIGEYNLEGLMDYVKEHNTGTLSTVYLIQDFASLFNDDTKQFIYQIFGKELKIGITAKTINKALGKGFIREFSVQLAHPYHKYTDKVPGSEFTLTQKLDGHRSVFIVKNGKGQFYTRKGLPINGLEIQTEQALKLADSLGNHGAEDYVLDGELLLSNDENMETKDLFRATSRILRSETADKSNIQYNVFDALSTKEFEDGKSENTFADRKRFLTMAFGDFDYNEPQSIDHIHLVKDLYVGSDISIIKKLQHEFVEPNGWEGLMLNLNNEYYVTKRTSGLLKIKEFFDADVLVKDVFEGTGKLKGTLGGIIIDYKGYEIKVGTGFTEVDRDFYWNNPDEIIGKIVDISYFEETHNQNNNNISLRFPVFVEKRTDKTFADISYEV